MPNDSAPLVSIVESDMNQGVLMEGLLEDKYRINLVDSAENALAAYAEMVPDVILLNVSLPDMSGYDLCRKLHENHELDSTKIFFVSSRADVDSILKGYDAGADDFIAKPVAETTLKAKIDNAMTHRNELRDLEDSVDTATETAMAIMQDSGELGVIINFLKESYGCEDFDALAVKALEVLHDWELSCVIQIRGKNETVTSSYSGSVSELELRLIEASIGGESIILLNHRCIFAVSLITLLVKNMPLDDEVKLGRYRDNIIILVNGANEKAKSITTANQLQLSTRIDNMVMQVHDQLGVVERQLKAYNEHAINTIQHFIDSMQEAFIHSGLTERQEEHFLSLAGNVLQEMETLTSDGNLMDSALEKIIYELENITRH